jgi:putative SOS response-associated peptidase YedK
MSHTKKLNTINARDDALLKPTGLWSKAKDRHRCIVPCQGFFEWTAQKQPYFIHSKEGPLLYLAGLYTPQTWTYTLITTAAMESLTFLHDRMPVILGKIDLTWLNPDIPFQKELLHMKTDDLEWYPVSHFVSKVGHDSKECVQRQASIQSFFQ